MADGVFFSAVLASDEATTAAEDGDRVEVAERAFVFSIVLASDGAAADGDGDTEGRVRTVVIGALAFDLHCELEASVPETAPNWRQSGIWGGGRALGWAELGAWGLRAQVGGLGGRSGAGDGMYQSRAALQLSVGRWRCGGHVAWRRQSARGAARSAGTRGWVAEWRHNENCTTLHSRAGEH